MSSTKIKDILKEKAQQYIRKWEDLGNVGNQL
jgi:hypothetical protein